MTVNVRKGEEATFQLPALAVTEDESYFLDGWNINTPAELIYDAESSVVPDYNAGQRKVKFSKSTVLHAFYRYSTAGVGGGVVGPGFE